MQVPDWGFPIAGARVSEALDAHFAAEDCWRITWFDIPSGGEGDEALDNLREMIESGSNVVSTEALSQALLKAPQVWILDMRLTSDNGVHLYIEDGMVFDMNFGPARRP